MKQDLKLTDAWRRLKEFTNARIGLGSIGNAMPLEEVLALKLAHAKAKDAIYTELDTEDLKKRIAEGLNLEVFEFRSKVKDRNQYLVRPDFGKLLGISNSRQKYPPTDILFVITDGLSASAVNNNALEVLNILVPEIRDQFTLSVALVEQGRVAIGDEVAELFNAKFVAVFIGERPGLSSPESMGIYTTFSPRSGFTDEKRNCISNIHQNGLKDFQAALILKFLIIQSFHLKMSGVGLKVDLRSLIS